MRNVIWKGLRTRAYRLADGLGWFSLSLGAAELFLPRRLGEKLGWGHRPSLVAAYGLREIVTGIGILASSYRKRPWVIARIAGDALDALTLAPRVLRGPRRRGAALALVNVLAVAALDTECARRLPA